MSGYTEQEREEIDTLLGGDYGASTLATFWFWHNSHGLEEYEDAVLRLAELVRIRRGREAAQRGRKPTNDPRLTHTKDNRQAKPQ